MKTSKTLIYLAFISFSLLWTHAQKVVKQCNANQSYSRISYKSIRLDIEKPRMSWTLEPTKESDFGQSQTAYRILVSMSESRLKDNVGDIGLWLGRIRQNAVDRI